jgi:hypothetical protein
MKEPAKHLIAHNPDCANRLAYKPIPWVKKTTDAQLFGATYPELYPLRHKIEKGIESGEIKAIQFKHSGYNQDSSWFESLKNQFFHTDIPNNYSRGNKDYQSLLLPQLLFAHEMQTTKICIFDTSFVKKAIRKFQEALSSGCVIASDMPFEMQELLNGVIIELKFDMTPIQINTIIQEALADEQELKRKAARGLKLAQELFWCERKAERMVRLYEDYVDGHRGYYFPFGYRLGCHSYIDSQPSNPWCEKNNLTVEVKGEKVQD